MAGLPLHEKVAVLMRLHRLHDEPGRTAELAALRDELETILAAADRLLADIDRGVTRGH